MNVFIYVHVYPCAKNSSISCNLIKIRCLNSHTFTTQTCREYMRANLTSNFNKIAFHVNQGKINNTLLLSLFLCFIPGYDLLNITVNKWSFRFFNFQHQIDVVLASGKISSDLQGQLPHIIFIHNVPYSALQSICSASDVTMAIYITDISQVMTEVNFKQCLYS